MMEDLKFVGEMLNLGEPSVIISKCEDVTGINLRGNW